MKQELPQTTQPVNAEEFQIPYAPVHQDRTERQKTEEVGFDSEEFNKQFGKPALKGFLGESLQHAVQTDFDRKNPTEISKSMPDMSEFEEDAAKEVLRNQQDRVSGRSGGFTGMSNAPSQHKTLGGPKVNV